ncbi:MAG: hypothetical protein GX465_19070 [Acidobacteria bacterium]|nr:hypothetical protein [Acidobacteriota bacterium]
MTPEELNELRKSAEMVQRIGIQNAAICEHPYNGVNNASFALVNLPDLLAHIDSQAAQIAALKEKLVESQAAINSLSLPLGMDPIDLGIDWSEGELEAARQQLKAEMPGVKWE